MSYIYSVSHLHVVLSVLLWYVMLYLCYRQTRQYDVIEPEFEEDEPEFFKPNGFQIKMLILGLAFCTIGCTGGDFLHNFKIYDMNVASNEPIHYEHYYYYLTQILPHNYYIWRFFVWGIAYIIVCFLIRRLDTDADIAYIIFILFLLNHFPNLRQSLGVVILILGLFVLTRISSSSTPVLMLCASLGLIAFSTIFHSTMYAFMAIALLCFVPGIKNKYTIIVAICIFPYLYNSIHDTSSLITQYIFSHNADALEKATSYLNSDYRVTSNVFGWIKIIINRSPFYILLAISTWRIFFRGEQVSYLEKHLLMFSLVLVYISVLFWGNDVSAYLSTRFWDNAIYPLAFFSMIYIRNHWEERIIRYTLYLLLFSNTYNLVYEIYNVDRLNAEFALFSV